MAIVKIQFRRDNTTNWTNVNPFISLGEPTWDTDLKILRVGEDGDYNDITTGFYANDQSLKTTDDVRFNSTIQSYSKFELTGSGVYDEGKFEYCDRDKSVKFYNDDPTVDPLIFGQGTRMRIYNDTTSSIDKGKIVTVVNVTSEGVPIIDLAIASNELSALNVVGMSAHIIQPNSYGYVTTRGFLRNVDTSTLQGGSLIFLSATDAGEAVIVAPSSPNWTVKLGGVAKQDVTDGVFYVELLVLDNLEGFHKFYNGSVLEPQLMNVTSDGTDVTLTIDNFMTGSGISLIFDEQFYVQETPISVTLMSGSDEEPQNNFVYIPKSTKQLTVSTTHYPTDEQYIPVAHVVCQSPSSVQTDRIMKIDDWTEHLSDTVGLGYLVHLNSWIKRSNPKFIAGNIFGTSVAEDVTAANIDISYTNGIIARLEFDDVPGYNTAISDTIYMINDFTTPFRQISSLNSTDLAFDSTGNSIGNGYFNVVIWATVSRDIEDCKLFMNLPNDSYSNVSDAINDIGFSTDYTIGRAYEGSGYLLTKLTLKNSGGSITIVGAGTKDLRGLIPSIGAGGGVTGGTGITTYTELTDTPISRVGKANSVLFVKDNELSDDYSNTLYANDTTSTVTVSGSFQISNTAPTSATDSGVKGEIVTDEDFIYICTATNTWKRTAITTW